MGDVNGGFIVYKRKRKGNILKADGDELQEEVEFDESGMEQRQVAPTFDAQIGNVMVQETPQEDKLDDKLLVLREFKQKSMEERADKQKQGNYEESNEVQQLTPEYTQLGLAMREKYAQLRKRQKGRLQLRDGGKGPRQVGAKQRSDHDISKRKGVNAPSSSISLKGKGIADPNAEAPQLAQNVSGSGGLQSNTSLLLNKNVNACRRALTSLKGKGIAVPNAALQVIQNLSALGGLQSNTSLLNKNVNACNCGRISLKGKGITIADAAAAVPKLTQNGSASGGLQSNTKTSLLNAIANACSFATSFKGKGITGPSTVLPKVAQNVSASGGLQSNVPLLNENVNACKCALSLKAKGITVPNAALPPKAAQKDSTSGGLQSLLNKNLKPKPLIRKKPAGFLKRNTKPNDWSELELDALWVGVRRYGQDNWENILTDPTGYIFKNRSPQDLSTKWNMELLKILNPRPQTIIPNSILPTTPSSSTSSQLRQGSYLLRPPPHLGPPNYPTPPVIGTFFPTTPEFPRMKDNKNNNGGCEDHSPVIVIDSDSDGCSEKTMSA